jgi:hypothetical protein
VSVVGDLRPTGLEARLWKLCLELLRRGQTRTLIISLKKQFLCGKTELSTGSYILILHIICLLQVMFIVPNSKDVDWFQGCMYCCTNQPLMHLLWIHTFFKGYILDPKMVGASQGSTLSTDTWELFQHKITPNFVLSPTYYT